MAEVIFINEDYIKKYTSINGSVDPNILYPAIYLAQDKWVAPYCGDNLWDKLKADVAAATISGDYLYLLDNYVRKAVLWWSMVEAIPNLTYRVDNGTLVQRTSEDVQPVSDGIVKDMIDRYKSNAENYTRRLVEYLCANSELFPEYSTYTSPQRPPKTDVLNSMTYIFSNGYKYKPVDKDSLPK